MYLCLSFCVNLPLQEYYGFKSHTPRTVGWFIAGIFTTGLVFLIFSWKPDWRMRAMCTRCPLEEAEFILLRVRFISGLYLGSTFSIHYRWIFQWGLLKNDPSEGPTSKSWMVSEFFVGYHLLKFSCVNKITFEITTYNALTKWMKKMVGCFKS